MNWPLQRDCDKFYGNPRGSGSSASRSWEVGCLTRVKPPFAMYYDGRPVSYILMNRKCADSFRRVLNKIWIAAGKDQRTVDKWGASTYAGSYVYRKKRGGSTLSMHSYGCAIDLDPARNGFRNPHPHFGRGDAFKVVEAFESEGWEWGGRWAGRSSDGMHFQAAWTRPDAVTPRSAPTPVTPIWPAPATPKAAPTPTTPEEPDVAWVQARLTALNYATGGADGVIGPLTRSAIRDFQDDNNLVINGRLDQATVSLLESDDVQPRRVPPERAALTVADLRANGSKIIEAAEESKFGAIGAGLATTAAAATNASSIVGSVKEMTAGAEAGVSWTELAETYWPVFVTIASIVAVSYFAWLAYRAAKKVEAERVDNARKGINVRL
jgi:hypothetical protein